MLLARQRGQLHAQPTELIGVDRGLLRIDARRRRQQQPHHVGVVRHRATNAHRIDGQVARDGEQPGGDRRSTRS